MRSMGLAKCYSMRSLSLQRGIFDGGTRVRLWHRRPAILQFLGSTRLSVGKFLSISENQHIERVVCNFQSSDIRTPFF